MLCLLQSNAPQSWSTFILQKTKQESVRRHLVLLALLLTLALSGLSADLLVVLLESSQVLTGLGELALLHTLADIPVDEGMLGVHEIELVVNAGEDLSDG